MKYTRIVQAYIGLLSVVGLALVGAGTYIWQSGQVISSADETSASQPFNTLFLVTDQESLKAGQETVVTLLGNINDAVTGATVNLYYSNDILDISELSFSDGLFGQAASQNIDKESGLITFTFSPLTGVSESGKIASFKVKAKQPGIATIDFQNSDDAQKNTSLTTATSILQIPETSGLYITIEE